MTRLTSGNIYAKIPKHINHEIFKELFKGKNLTIKRILSHGQTTEWLKQNTDEWAILLKGNATLLFKKENREIKLKSGNYLYIPKGCVHRVSRTDPKQKCIWLTVHNKNN